MARPRRTSSAALAALGPESCAIYLRISQDRTGEQLGVDRQERECRDLARRLGLAVDTVFTDNDVSATSGRVRPGFEALLKASPEVIIAWHQDRLLRKGADLERVIDLNVPVHTVTAGTLDLTNPAGRAVARTVAAWSTYEGEQKALRQQAANRQRAESGHWTFSRRPYGYERVNGAVCIIEAEAEIVREGYRRYIAGESYYAIAADWNARGVATFTEAWSTARVRQMLRNERYAGIVEVDGERLDVPASWPAIIDDRTWSDYAATRDGRTRAGSWSTSTKHLLSGMLVCGVCGSGMLSRPDRGRLYYTCKASWCVSTLQEDADALVEGVVLARLADKGIVRALRHVPDTAPLQDELASLRKRRDAVTELLADGLIDRRKAREQLTDLTAKLDRTATRLGALRRESPLTDLALARSVPTRWRRLSVLEQRRVIEELGLRVTVNKGRRGPRRRGADGQPLPDFDRYAFEWLDAAAAVTE